VPENEQENVISWKNMNVEQFQIVCADISDGNGKNGDIKYYGYG